MRSNGRWTPTSEDKMTDLIYPLRDRDVPTLWLMSRDTEYTVPKNMTSTDRPEGALVTSRTESKTLNPGEVLKEVDNLYFMV